MSSGHKKVRPGESPEERSPGRCFPVSKSLLWSWGPYEGGPPLEGRDPQFRSQFYHWLLCDLR